MGHLLAVQPLIFPVQAYQCLRVPGGHRLYDSVRQDVYKRQTLGTGVGGGIVADGQLLEGVGGTGADVGHTVLVLDLSLIHIFPVWRNVRCTTPCS